MTRVWSPYQTAIFDFVSNPEKGNLIVEAVAGSGKSTTIVEAISRVDDDAAVVFLAFNKAIATELKSRGVNAKTFHSLVFGAVMRAKNVREPNLNKMRDLQDAMLDYTEGKMYGAFIRKLVGLGKQIGVGIPGMADDCEQVWYDLINHHDMELEHDAAEMHVAIELTRKLFWQSVNSRQVDFDDMLYFAVKDGITLPRFDWVFVDEAQDTNAIQRAILRKIMHPRSRMVAVGDPAQAIYGFRGSDSNSLNMIAEEFGAETLPLSVSYRCGQSIVQYAHKWVAHIEAAPGAADGSVEHRQLWSTDGFTADDLVICRTTKPLVALGYRMLRDRKPVHILGKEIGQGLVALIKKQKAKGIPKLEEKLWAYREREVEKAAERKQENRASAVADKVDAILCLIDSLSENDRTVPALIDIIEQLFSDTKNATTLCTIHKAKGLEADRVFWLNRSQCPSKWARREWQQEQERNLCYVATTRAKSTLVLIEEEGLR